MNKFLLAVLTVVLFAGLKSSHASYDSNLESMMNSSEDSLNALYSEAPNIRKLPAPEVGVSNNDSTPVESSPLLRLVNSAQKSIDIEIYQMENAQFINGLRAALKRKVKIRIIKDPKPLGDACNLFTQMTKKQLSELDPSCTDQINLKKEILAAGGKFIPYLKKELCADSSKPCYLHGKLVIADKKTALISTGNFNDTNLCDLTAETTPTRCNRDFSIVTKDNNVLSALNAIFEKDLIGLKYDVKTILASYKVENKLTVSPNSLEPLVAYIDSAKKSLTIQNQYLNEPTMNEAITRAIARGVKTTIMVSSICAFGKPNPKKAADATKLYGGFEDAGAKIKMFTSRMHVGGKQGYLHAKIFMIDGNSAWVGSVNGSSAATSNNREFGLFTTTPKDLSVLKTVVGSDINNSNAETWKQSIVCEKDDPLTN